MQAWREGRGRGKEEKEGHTGKRGEETKISVFVEAELQGPSKSEKKFSSEKGRAKWQGKRKWLGWHTQPAHIVHQKKLFFLMGGKFHSPYFFSEKGVESNHTHVWFNIYYSFLSGSLAR